MKKGLKKFLGVAMVSGISASAIGSNYCGANAVYAASVPGMTDEEVKLMNAGAEYLFLSQEMWNTEPSQWGDNFLFRHKKLRMIFDMYNGKDFNTLWEKCFSKNEFWKRADAVREQLFEKEVPSNEEKAILMYNWLKQNLG